MTFTAFDGRARFRYDPKAELKDGYNGGRVRKFKALVEVTHYSVNPLVNSRLKHLISTSEKKNWR